jgi:ubiquinone/menaquinone biosynthesis C-methylase UbiE
MDYRTSHLKKGKDYDNALSKGDFDTYMTQKERKILSSVIPTLFPGKIPRYLDFACGTGRITYLLENFVLESYGVDISEKMMEQAKRKCTRTNFVLKDITKDNLELEPVHLVTAFRFFGNAQDELRKVVLRSLSKLLVNRGFLIINNHRNPYSLLKILEKLTGGKDPADLSYYKLKKYLACAGFKIVRIYGIGFWMINYRLNKPHILDSKLVKVIEPLSLIPGISLLCPDTVIIAQKICDAY